MTLTAEIALDAKDQLGEAPFWDDDHDELLRVDITRGRVHGWSPSTGASWCRQYGGMVSAVIPRANALGYVVAESHRLILDEGEKQQAIAEVETDRPDNRFNDCKCDPQGRLWAGTMSMIRAHEEASLYRATPDRQVEQVVARTTISNGLGWSPGGDQMYFIDSTTQRIDVFDFDQAAGNPTGRRPFVSIDASDGLPDGLAVDAEGGVWVCLFGGGALRRYDENGHLDVVAPLPVTNPTSVAFGGSALQTMYVTSARHRLTDEQLDSEPLAGAVLAIEPGIAGLPGNRFAG